MPDSQWYNSRQLFEQILGVSNEIRDLSSEMKETQNIIKQYNGLREEIGEIQIEVDELKKAVSETQTRSDERSKVGQFIRDWGGWLIAIVSFILLLL